MKEMIVSYLKDRENTCYGLTNCKLQRVYIFSKRKDFSASLAGHFYSLSNLYPTYNFRKS